MNNEINQENDNMGATSPQTMTQQPVMPQQEIPQIPSPEQKPNKNIGGIIGIIALVLVIAIAVGYMFLKGDNKAKEDSAKEANTEQTEEIEVPTDSVEQRFGGTFPFEDEKYGSVEMKYYGKVTYEIINAENYKKRYKSTDECTEELIGWIQAAMEKYAKETTTKSWSKLTSETSDMNKYIWDYIYEAEKENKFIRLQIMKVESISLSDESTKKINEMIQQEITGNQTTESTNTTKKDIVIEANIDMISKEDGGRHTPAFTNYEMTIQLEKSYSAKVTKIKNDEMLTPGQSYTIEITIKDCEEEVKTGQSFEALEKERIVMKGTVLSSKNS